MKVKPTLIVNFHTDEGRGMFQVSLEQFTTLERAFILRTFNEAEEGVEFAIERSDDDPRSVMKFIIGKPEQTVQ